MGHRRKVVAAAQPLPAWYVETTADGGTHHGPLRDTGVVVADCGSRFLPLCHASKPGVVMRWNEPPDEMAACPVCWEKVHGNTSFYEVASG